MLQTEFEFTLPCGFLDEDGTLRKTPWLSIIGEDYVVRAFEFAHEADPAAELYYNDYSVENAPKRTGVIALIRKLQAAGIRVAAVGLQGHDTMTWPTVAQEDSTLAAVAALGVKVNITELDIDVLPAVTRSPTAEVTLSAGEPTQACQSVQGVLVHAPLTVQSADGIVNHTRSMALNLHVAGGGAGGVGAAGEASMPLVPAPDFERTSGLTGFDLADGAYAGVHLRGSAEPNGAREGALSATEWIDGEERPIEPVLGWCDGPECERFWCELSYQSSECP